MNAKPRRVKATITRTVTEVAIVVLDRYGCVEEVEEIIDEVTLHDVDLLSIHDVRTVHP